MLCYRYSLHIKATVKKVAGAPEVPQVPAVNPEAGIRHQDSPSKSREEQAQAETSLPAVESASWDGAAVRLCLPTGGQLHHTVHPFCLRVRASFRKKEVSCVQPSLSSCLGSLVSSP